MNDENTLDPASMDDLIPGIVRSTFKLSFLIHHRIVLDRWVVLYWRNDNLIWRRLSYWNSIEFFLKV